MQWSDLVGRTIVRAEEIPYAPEVWSDVRLTLDDGSVVELTAEGHEADGIGLERIGLAERNERRREAMGRRERRRYPEPIDPDRLLMMNSIVADRFANLVRQELALSRLDWTRDMNRQGYIVVVDANGG